MVVLLSPNKGMVGKPGAIGYVCRKEDILVPCQREDLLLGRRKNC